MFQHVYAALSPASGRNDAASALIHPLDSCNAKIKIFIFLKIAHRSKKKDAFS
jgi:hypothetical protein